MKKLLKADEVKALFVASGVAVEKEDYEQLILAIKRSATWGASTEADVTITHSDAVGGVYTTFKAFTLSPAASEVLQFQVNLVGVKDFFKVVIEGDLLDAIGILADDRDVDTADVEELPVPAVIHATLSL